ncbi:CotH kinase family protein [Rossellomorea aquimaris]|uniref:CotH kinase family protein n=1 Tax=Rossellomorea aquimaris TaxID=189382 RepID=UPI001CD1F89C|nr:CotH kinase family protein [Rossellomorea aquimaris]MCA1056642.1 CotH kinase family protein [Rossellomorea aquimaris]
MDYHYDERSIMVMTSSLPLYELLFEENDLRELESDVWNDLPVPANLKIEQKTYDIDICYRGSYTRELEKKSYYVEFVNPRTYGDKLDIHLNAELYDPSHFRNKLSLDFMRDIGIHTPESQHIFLVQDGNPLGLYLQLESVDQIYLESRNLPLGPIYYATNNNANFSLMRKGKKKKSLVSGYQRKVGNEQDDQYLIELIKTINTSPIASLSDSLPNLLDVENYLKWLAGAVCTMNNDGFTHNYALYRNPENGLFTIIPWDYDATFGRKVSGGVMNYDYVPLTGKAKNKLTTQLMNVPEFRRQYKEIVEDILETKFTVEYLKENVMKLHESLRPYVLNDPHIKKGIRQYDREPSFIFRFIEARAAFLKDELKQLK